jgi:hypothetical protein
MSMPGKIPSSGTEAARSLGLIGKPFAIATLAALAVLGVAAIGERASHYSFGYFTRDPAAITHQAPYMGMVSFFGLFGWAVGSTALVFGGYAASLRGARDRRTALFLTAAALVYFLLDDSFEFHEDVFPRYLHLRPDSVTQAVYVAVTVVAVVKYRRFLADTNMPMLIGAGVFFAISIGFDILIPSERAVALEDGAKLIGIFVLAAYCVDAALAESRLTFSDVGGPSPERFSEPAGAPRPLPKAADSD